MRRMSERQAWRYLANLFGKAGFAKTLPTRGQVETRGRRRESAYFLLDADDPTTLRFKVFEGGVYSGVAGMCGCLTELRESGRITAATWTRMEAVLDVGMDRAFKRAHWPFMYATTQAGARKRMRFCERQAKRLAR